jgi:hypothetical protein
VNLSFLAVVSLGCALAAAVILVGYLTRRPALTGMVKIWLLLGLGVLPIGAAASGNVQGYNTTKQRSFCADCHVMAPQVTDSDDPHSGSLSSRHSRTALFGAENCYVCHEDYGMFGTVLTKADGMKHVWLYYTQYLHVSAEAAKSRIHLYQPYPNESCMQCHSTTDTLWNAVPDHTAALAAVRSNQVSCASVGCHGFAHPNARPPVTP